MHLVSVESPPIKICNHLQEFEWLLSVRNKIYINDIFIVHIACLLIWDVQYIVLTKNIIDK